MKLSNGEKMKPYHQKNMMSTEFKEFLPIMREYLNFLIYYLEFEYHDSEEYEDVDEKSSSKMLGDADVILQKLETAYNGNVKNYNDVVWDTSNIDKQEVYLMSSYIERILNTTMVTIKNNLTKSDRSLLRKAQGVLISLTVTLWNK